MKNIQRRLLLMYWLPIGVSLLIVVLYESELLLPGGLEPDRELDFYVSTVMECLTICLIPVALRLFKFPAVKRAVNGGGKGYVLWAAIRLMLLTFPMMLNTWIYYQFVNVAYGYMAIIGLLSLVLVYPSRSRYIHETGQD